MDAADIRLAGLLVLALGWPDWTTLISDTLLGLLYGSLTGATLIALRRASRHTLIPFGPRPDRRSLHRPAPPPRLSITQHHGESSA